jgi:hypothetical protein
VIVCLTRYQGDELPPYYELPFVIQGCEHADQLCHGSDLISTSATLHVLLKLSFHGNAYWHRVALEIHFVWKGSASMQTVFMLGAYMLWFSSNQDTAW